MQHHPAVPIDDMPSFIMALLQRVSLAARALEFAVMTAARSGEVLVAAWGEIDTDARMWTIPGPRMKAKREHRCLCVTRRSRFCKSSQGPRMLTWSSLARRTSHCQT